MKRTVLFGAIALLSAAAAMAGGSKDASSGTAGKYDKVTLKFGHIFNADHAQAKGAAKFAELVEQKTGGAVKVQVYPNSQLGAEKDIFDMVVAGSVDMISTGYGLAAKRYAPAAIIDTGFIAKDRDHLMRILGSDAFKDIAEGVRKNIGVRTLAGFYFGARQTTTNKKVESAADLKNLKLRAPENPTVMAAVKAMGAIPTPMALSEVYVALSQGVVDGQENPPAVILSQKFYEVQKNLVKTNHLVQPSFIFISDKVMSKLSPATQAVIEECAKEAAAYNTKLAFADEDAAFTTLKEKGMNIVDIDPAAFADAAAKLHADLAAKVGDASLIERIKAVK